MKSRLFLLLICASCTVPPTKADSPASINEEIQRIATGRKIPRIGVCAKNFKTGETILINGDKLFPTASIIKLPILTELFFEMSEGKLQRDQELSYADADKVQGSGIIQHFAAAGKIRLIDAATLMIIQSDNTATNLILDCFGREHDEKLDAVNKRMELLGINNTRLLNKVFSFKTKKDTPEAKKFGLGYTTPIDVVLLLEKLYNGKIVNRKVSDEMLRIMKNQQDESMMRRFLPIEEGKVAVANKTGAVDHFRGDVGIVFTSKCDYAVAIFCDELADTSYALDCDAHLAVAELSKAIYDRFNQ